MDKEEDEPRLDPFGTNGVFIMALAYILSMMIREYWLGG